MAGETDPLLPQHVAAPEISASGPNLEFQLYGNKASNEHVTIEKQNACSGRSKARSIISLAVIFAIFLVVANNLARLGLDEDPRPIVPHDPHSEKSVEARVHKILTDTPLIDGHNDLAIFIRGRYQNDIASTKFRNKFEDGGMEAQVDIPRLNKGMVGGAFWSAFTVCPDNASDDFSDEEYASSVAHTMEQIDVLKRLQAQYPKTFTPAGSSLDTMLDKFHTDRSLFGAISIEGLHQVSQKSALSTLRLYYELGVRAATLTWNCHNAFADAALITSNGTTKIAPYHRGGLTQQGRHLVKEMNRLGMLVDISHTSYWTQKAVLSNGTSRAPVIFTHSSAFAICPHPRNVKNDILDLVKSTNSLVMVNFSPDFISCKGDGVTMPTFYERNSTLHQVARHIRYIGSRIGYDHVGLGSDFDGIETTPKGLDGVDKYPDLIAELLKMGVSDADAVKVVGGNILRVWREAEQISTQMKNEGELPGRDEVHGWSREL